MRDPDNVELRIERGFEYVRLNAYQSAVKDFQHALELSPENPQAFLGLGQAYYYQLQWQKAEEALGTAVAFEEDLEQPHFWLGKLYYLQGRYEESAAEFDWAAEINRDNPVNEAWLGRAAAKLEDIEEARGAAERALGLDQEVAIAHVARAEAYVLEEEYEAAHGDLLYAKNLEPHDFEVLNALARFYAVHMPERMVEAERLAQQAEQWARWDIEVARALHTQAKIRIAQERTEEAKELLAAASDLATANGKIQLPGLVEDFDKLLQP
jgi:tetratricopeptide (TPR) repeat protein